MWWHYNGLRQGGFAVEEEGTDTRNTDLTDSLKISCQLIVGLMDTSMKMSWLFYVHAQSFLDESVRIGSFFMYWELQVTSLNGYSVKNAGDLSSY